ncbi:MAG: hypothetical protein DWQ01_14440 [Planctomycetota bacterium]|nr:MAG: hypothetical protein DWQ01_14440 [Planctomycetota bacterium]
MRPAWLRAGIRAGITGAIFSAGLASGCGLLVGDPELPSLQEVQQARRHQGEPWTELAAAAAKVQAGGEEALADLRRQASGRPDDLRLAILVQDLEMDFYGPEALLDRYENAFEQQPSAAAAFLAARVQPGARLSQSWIDKALELDPKLLQARIWDLADRAKQPSEEVLRELAQLLQEHPECAEGWRLMQFLAPDLGRPDWALHALETEPWGGQTDLRELWLGQARAAMDADRPTLAAEILARMDPRDVDAGILRAALWTSQGHPGRAYRFLEELQEIHPDHPQLVFNLGLLALDYLDRKAMAARHFQRFLELFQGGAAAPLDRELQARLWLERLQAEGFGLPSDPSPK